MHNLWWSVQKQGGTDASHEVSWIIQNFQVYVLWKSVLEVEPPVETHGVSQYSAPFPM
jgi:hypothetical protein